jgi:hypothetical protein
MKEGEESSLLHRPENGLDSDHSRQSFEASSLRDLKDSISLGLAHPRSKWLRSCISESEFYVLARAADWSSYDYESPSSRLHSLCKVIVDLNRYEASRELGYSTNLFALLNDQAGTVIVSHILVGKHLILLEGFKPN